MNSQNSQPRQQQSGFTLIELVVVIVILGILAATALPKFLDLRGDAAQAAVEGIAGSIASGSAINYAKFQVSPVTATAITSTTACNTAAITGLLISAPNAADASLAVTAVGTCATGGLTGSCIVTSARDTTKTATAQIICTG